MRKWIDIISESTALHGFVGFYPDGEGYVSRDHKWRLVPEGPDLWSLMTMDGMKSDRAKTTAETKAFLRAQFNRRARNNKGRADVTFSDDLNWSWEDTSALSGDFGVPKR